MHRCRLLSENIIIELGVVPIINIDDERYIAVSVSPVYINYKGINEVYLRGIKLNDCSIMPQIVLYGINCNKCVVNILSKDVFPNVARNNLMENVGDLISSAIEKAALQYIASNITDKNIQEALYIFINKNFSENNPFIAK